MAATRVGGFDALNEPLSYRIGGAAARGAWSFDMRGVDGIVNGVATVTAALGARVRRVQTGRVQDYALCIAFGLPALAAGFLVLAVRR